MPDAEAERLPVIGAAEVQALIAALPTPGAAPLDLGEMGFRVLQTIGVGLGGLAARNLGLQRDDAGAHEAQVIHIVHGRVHSAWAGPIAFPIAAVTAR